jgi:putative transposase
MQEWSGVSESARQLAMSRFRLIQPHLEENRPLQTVAADAKLMFRTAQRWVSLYRKFGLLALASAQVT